MRIRSIKPQIWESEQIALASDSAKLLFIALITFVDDEGRCPLSLLRITKHLYPYDLGKVGFVDQVLAELNQLGLIYGYQTEDGSAYLQICKFKDHQKIDKMSPSKYPAPKKEAINSHLIIAHNEVRNHILEFGCSQMVKNSSNGRDHSPTGIEDYRGLTETMGMVAEGRSLILILDKEKEIGERSIDTGYGYGTEGRNESDPKSESESNAPKGADLISVLEVGDIPVESQCIDQGEGAGAGSAAILAQKFYDLRFPGEQVTPHLVDCWEELLQSYPYEYLDLLLVWLKKSPDDFFRARLFPKCKTPLRLTRSLSSNWDKIRTDFETNCKFDFPNAAHVVESVIQARSAV
jgi:hypothetical protein